MSQQKLWIEDIAMYALFEKCLSGLSTVILAIFLSEIYFTTKIVE